MFAVVSERHFVTDAKVRDLVLGAAHLELIHLMLMGTLGKVSAATLEKLFAKAESDHVRLLLSDLVLYSKAYSTRLAKYMAGCLGTIPGDVDMKDWRQSGYQGRAAEWLLTTTKLSDADVFRLVSRFRLQNKWVQGGYAKNPATLRTFRAYMEEDLPADSAGVDPRLSCLGLVLDGKAAFSVPLGENTPTWLLEALAHNPRAPYSLSGMLEYDRVGDYMTLLVQSAAHAARDLSETVLERYFVTLAKSNSNLVRTNTFASLANLLAEREREAAERVAAKAAKQAARKDAE